ncbi:hypothetical protein TVAGG3_0169240, partial [Trichomonas vaginalis G3]
NIIQTRLYVFLLKLWIGFLWTVHSQRIQIVQVQHLQQ